jgi:hypothetical protein
MARIDADVLDHCLLRIQSGEATLEECLEENSSYAELLEPLLRVAAVTHAQLAPIGPSEAFVTHSPTKVMNLARARMKVAAPNPPRRLVWLWQPAFRVAGIFLAIALLVGSVGVAYASDDALPGDNLYGVKRGLERAALVVSLSAAGDAELLLDHANRRIAEVDALVRLGRSSDIGPALEGYEHAIQKGLEIAAEHGGTLGDFEAALGTHEQVLKGVLDAAPDQAIPGLKRALENSRNGQEKVEQIRGDQHPSESAPGQLKKTPEASESETELPAGQQNRGQGHNQTPGQLKKTQTPDSNGSD